MDKTKILIAVESGEQAMQLDDVIIDIIEKAGGEITGIQTSFNCYSRLHTESLDILIAKKECTFNDVYDRVVNLSGKEKLDAKLKV